MYPEQREKAEYYVGKYLVPYFEQIARHVNKREFDLADFKLRHVTSMIAQYFVTLKPLHKDRTESLFNDYVEELKKQFMEYSNGQSN